MKRMLMLASVPSMIGQFNMNNIKILQELGYQIDVACNFHDRSVWDDKRVQDFINELKEKKIKIYQIDFSRSSKNIVQHIKSYQQLNLLIKKRKYDFIHCHTPIAGAIARLVAHKNNIKVIYTAHGFHFFKGAPVKNWILYYPVERFLARYTNVLITINREDYRRAKTFKAKRVEYVPGVGVDIERFQNCKVTKKSKRNELAIPLEALVLLSVGELSSRKNHQIIIKALGEMNDKSIYYIIAGRGVEYKNYRKLIEKYGISENMRMLGARTDVDELCVAADVFVHPSIREGLGIAPIEGMAAGLPLISSYVNGIKDYTVNKVTGICIIDPLNVEEIKEAIIYLKNNKDFRDSCSRNNVGIAKKYSLQASQEIMVRIYRKY